MILKKGDMWSRFGEVDLFLFTSNPIVNKQGLAVMGRGIAKQVADRFPQIRRDFGNRLLSYDWNTIECDSLGIYDGQPIGYFMVKHHWKEPANVDIIERSTRYLCTYADSYGTPVALNFPGIGNGRLRREDVLPIIEKLPDNVEVWEYE